MGDHLFSPKILLDLVDNPPQDIGLNLVIDQNLKNPSVDLDDLTRVFYQENTLVSIGKGLEVFNAFDTGIFYCSTELFDALEQVKKQKKTNN